MTPYQLHLLADLAACFGPTVADPEDLEAVRAILAERQEFVGICESIQLWRDGAMIEWESIMSEIDRLVVKAQGGPACGG